MYQFLRDTRPKWPARSGACVSQKQLSAHAGAAFLTLHPTVYADLLSRKLPATAQGRTSSTRDGWEDPLAWVNESTRIH